MFKRHSAFVPGPREAAFRLFRGLLIVALGAALIVGGCLALNRNHVLVMNISGEAIPQAVVSVNGRDIFRGSLDAGASASVSFSVFVDGAYVVEATYADGRTFRQDIGYLEPFFGSSDLLELGADALTYNRRVTKTGSSPPRLQANGEYR